MRVCSSPSIPSGLDAPLGSALGPYSTEPSRRLNLRSGVRQSHAPYSPLQLHSLVLNHHRHLSRMSRQPRTTRISSISSVYSSESNTGSVFGASSSLLDSPRSPPSTGGFFDNAQGFGGLTEDPYAFALKAMSVQSMQRAQAGDGPEG